MNDKEQIKIEITQDKLVDLLLHAATREDIAKLTNESEQARKEFKVEMIELRKVDEQARKDFVAADEQVRKDFVAADSQARKDFHSEAERRSSEFKAEMLELRRDFKSDMATLESRLDRQFLKIDHRYNWIISIIAATGLTAYYYEVERQLL